MQASVCIVNTPEYAWLDKIRVTEKTNWALNVNWSAHLDSKQSSEFEVNFTSLLPLLRDQAPSVATIRCVMDKIKDIVAILNPGQTPVNAADQPIYAVAKQIQWHWPNQYGEEKLVMMFGGLHIEMAALKSIGTFLWDSFYGDG